VGIKIGVTYWTGRNLYAILMDTSVTPPQYYNTITDSFESYSGIDNTYAYALTEDGARHYYSSIDPMLNNNTYTLKIYEMIGSSENLDTDLFLTARDVSYSIDSDIVVTDESIYTALVAFIASGGGGGSGGGGTTQDLTDVLKYVKAILSDLGRRKL